MNVLSGLPSIISLILALLKDLVGLKIVLTMDFQVMSVMWIDWHNNTVRGGNVNA